MAFFKSMLNQKAGLNSDTVAGPVARLELNQALTVQLTVIRVGWTKKLCNTMCYGAGNIRVGVRGRCKGSPMRRGSTRACRPAHPGERRRHGGQNLKKTIADCNPVRNEPPPHVSVRSAWGRFPHASVIGARPVVNCGRGLAEPSLPQRAPRRREWQSAAFSNTLPRWRP